MSIRGRSVMEGDRRRGGRGFRNNRSYDGRRDVINVVMEGEVVRELDMIVVELEVEGKL